MLETRIKELEGKLVNTATSSTSTPSTANMSATNIPSITGGNTEPKKITPTPDDASAIKEQVRLQVEASLKAKAEQEEVVARKIAEEQARLDLMKAEQEKQAARNAAIAAEQQALQLRKQHDEEQRQICISTHYSRSQIQQGVDAAISTLTSSNESSKASIRSSYDLQIQSTKDELTAEITRQQEMSRGGVIVGDSLRKAADADIANLEARKSELLSLADTNLAAKISSVQVNAIGLQQESREAKCGI